MGEGGVPAVSAWSEIPQMSAIGKMIQNIHAGDQAVELAVVNHDGDVALLNTSVNCVSGVFRRRSRCAGS